MDCNAGSSNDPTCGIWVGYIPIDVLRTRIMSLAYLRHWARFVCTLVLVPFGHPRESTLWPLYQNVILRARPWQMLSVDGSIKLPTRVDAHIGVVPFSPR